MLSKLYVEKSSSKQYKTKFPFKLMKNKFFLIHRPTPHSLPLWATFLLINPNPSICYTFYIISPHIYVVKSLVIMEQFP